MRKFNELCAPSEWSTSRVWSEDEIIELAKSLFNDPRRYSNWSLQRNDWSYECQRVFVDIHTGEKIKLAHWIW